MIELLNNLSIKTSLVCLRIFSVEQGKLRFPFQTKFNTISSRTVSNKKSDLVKHDEPEVSPKQKDYNKTTETKMRSEGKTNTTEKSTGGSEEDDGKQIQEDRPHKSLVFEQMFPEHPDRLCYPDAYYEKTEEILITVFDSKEQGTGNNIKSCNKPIWAKRAEEEAKLLVHQNMYPMTAFGVRHQPFFETPEQRNRQKDQEYDQEEEEEEEEIIEGYVTTIETTICDPIHPDKRKNLPNTEESDSDRSEESEPERPGLSIFLMGIVVVLTCAYYKLWKRDPNLYGYVSNGGPFVRNVSLQGRKSPTSSEDIPSEVHYLIVGGGTAAHAASTAIKTNDPNSKILIISKEGYYPYMRPPLSKEMITENDNVTQKLKYTHINDLPRSIFYEPEIYFTPCDKLNVSETGGISVARGWTVSSINSHSKVVTLDDGKSIKYKKCLLATGSKPKNLSGFNDLPEEVKQRTTLFRGICDFQEITNFIREGMKSVAIIGGGYSGTELAISLRKRGLDVMQIIKGKGNMTEVLPEFLSSYITQKLQNLGINVLKESEVRGIQACGNGISLKINEDLEVRADHAIIAVGAEPDTELAESGNLETDKQLGGYIANSELEARSDLFIAGDCVSFYDISLKRRRRVDHHNHAMVTGRIAGENMTGKRGPFNQATYFWSDMSSDFRFEAVGVINGALPTVGIFLNEDEFEKGKNKSEKEKKKIPDDFNDLNKGVVFYLEQDRPVGILLWNLFNQSGIANQVLKTNVQKDKLFEVAKHFKLFSPGKETRTIEEHSLRTD